MKLPPMCLSFLAAFLLASSTYGEESLSAEEDLFAETSESSAEGELVTLGFVLFETNSSQITAEYDSVIAVVAEKVLSDSAMSLELTGHTDNTGSAELNEKLAKSRADAVREGLIKCGVPADRIAAFSYGQNRPLAENDSEEGKLLNRQVTIWGIVR